MFEKNLNVSLLLDFYGDVLSERQKEMLDMYYNDDFSLAEIAGTFSISRQGVRSVLKKGENILFEMEDKLHLAKRFLDMKTKSSEIADQLEIINKEINDGVISSKIHILIKEIKDMADL